VRSDEQERENIMDALTLWRALTMMMLAAAPAGALDASYEEAKVLAEALPAGPMATTMTSGAFVTAAFHPDFIKQHRHAAVAATMEGIEPL
jgi:hypothetical protein